MENKNSPLRIAGIDPGFGRVGVGLIEISSSKLSQSTGASGIVSTGRPYRHLFHGVIETDKSLSLPARLLEIYTKIFSFCQEFSPTEAGVEKLFFVKNVTTALMVSEARGVIQLALFQNHVEIFEYTPFEIKQSVTGNGHAEKMQVQKTLQLLLHLSAIPKPDDAADALAAAFCHANSRKMKRW